MSLSTYIPSENLYMPMPSPKSFLYQLRIKQVFIILLNYTGNLENFSMILIFSASERYSCEEDSSSDSFSYNIVILFTQAYTSAH